MNIQIGIIQEMQGTTATVVPNDRPDIVTLPLVVPFYWRETMGNLQAGEEVYFFENHEHGGYIVGRTDGNWDNVLRGTLTVTDDITAESNVLVDKDISSKANISAAMNITAIAGDVLAEDISLKQHIHPGDSGGKTGAPE